MEKYIQNFQMILLLKFTIISYFGYILKRKSFDTGSINSLLNQIEMLHDENPKLYWQLINELKGIKQNESSSLIFPSTQLSHFQNLNNPKSEFSAQIQHLEHLLAELEKKECFTELDYQISNSEIFKALSSVKANKSVGLNQISNNMIKSGQAYLLPCLLKFFVNV